MKSLRTVLCLCVRVIEAIEIEREVIGRMALGKRALTVKKIFSMRVFWAWGFVLMALAAWIPPAGAGPATDLMRRCEEVLCAEKERLGLFDPGLDPDRTGLVGLEFSLLTTSVGDVRDKRGAARPEMADAVAEYLRRAGVASGDWIAVNSSASYPGFTLATLCAAETMGAQVQMVFSYGSSMYGGNVPEFTFPAMLDLLNGKGLLRTRIRATSPGAIRDRVHDLLDENPWPLFQSILSGRREEHLPEYGVEQSVRRRLEIFDAAPRPVACFVSCGGPGASLGRSDRILSVGYGLLKRPDFPVPQGPDRGLIFEYLDRGVPVIHLLFTRGICQDFNIPYGP